MMDGMAAVSSAESSLGLSSKPKEPHMRATWARYSIEMLRDVRPLGTAEMWQPMEEGG